VQFFGVAGLQEVQVEPRLVAAADLLLAALRQGDEQRLGRLRLPPQPAGDLAAVQARQVEAQEDRGGRQGEGHRQGGRGVVGNYGLEAPPLQVPCEGDGCVVAVIHDQDVGAR
jgi:hypothetical protein